MKGLRHGFVVAFALAVGCLATSAPPAFAAVDSKLTLFFTDKEFEEPGDTDKEDQFEGKVKSDVDTCKKGRKISVYIIPDGSPDSNVLIGTTQSKSNGDWSLVQKDPGDGVITAKAAKKTKGEIVCKAAKDGTELGDYEGPVDDDGDNFFTYGGGDCDDTDAQRNPDAIEILNFKDDDCDGVGDISSDLDADGFNGPTDCDDTDASVKPGATETLDGRDEDCDGVSDEGFYEVI